MAWMREARYANAVRAAAFDTQPCLLSTADMTDLRVVHQPRAEALDLLVGGHRTERNLPRSPARSEQGTVSSQRQTQLTSSTSTCPKLPVLGDNAATSLRGVSSLHCTSSFRTEDSPCTQKTVVKSYYAPSQHWHDHRDVSQAVACLQVLEGLQGSAARLRVGVSTCLCVEGAVRDAAHYGTPLPDDGDGAVAAVQHQARDVLAGHVGQLPREDVLQRDQPAFATYQRCTGVRDGHRPSEHMNAEHWQPVATRPAGSVYS